MAPSQAYPPGIELYHQGDPAKVVYLIEQGLVKLIRLEENGQELIIGLRYPGWLLGAASVVLQQSYSVMAVTVTACRLRRIQAEEFRQLVRANPELSWSLNRILSCEIYDHVAHTCDLGLHSARKRLEQFLWNLISSTDEIKQQNPLRLQLLLKKSEVARLIAVAPQYLSELLRQLENEGILRREKGSLIVLDRERLWHEAEF